MQPALLMISAALFAIGLLSIMTFLLLCIIVFHYVTREREMEVEGKILSLHDMKVPIYLNNIYQPADLFGSSYWNLDAPYMMHEYIVQVETPDKRKLEVNLAKELYESICKELYKIGRRIKFHCTQNLFNKEIYARDFVLDG